MHIKTTDAIVSIEMSRGRLADVACCGFEDVRVVICGESAVSVECSQAE